MVLYNSSRLQRLPQSKQHLLPGADKAQHTKKLKPIYPWAGGKKKLLKRYKDLIPSLEGFESFIEPFFGGGAFFCNAVNDSLINEFVMNDINTEIVQIYEVIKSYPERFIAKCETLATMFNQLQNDDLKKALFYSWRDVYTSLDPTDIESSAILLILLKLSYGGVWKSNKSTNRFSGSYGGKGKKVKIDAELIQNWHRQLQNTDINQVHYRDLVIPDTPSLIFCDPPYRGTKIDYSAAFTDLDHIELIRWCESQSKRGHTVILTNQDIGDNFFNLNLPKNVETHLIDYKYTVGTCRVNQKAKDVKEIIVIFHPVTASATTFEKITCGSEYHNLPTAINDCSYEMNVPMPWLVPGKINVKHNNGRVRWPSIACVWAYSLKACGRLFTIIITGFRFSGKWEFAP